MEAVPGGATSQWLRNLRSWLGPGPANKHVSQWSTTQSFFVFFWNSGFYSVVAMNHHLVLVLVFGGGGGVNMYHCLKPVSLTRTNVSLPPQRAPDSGPTAWWPRPTPPSLQRTSQPSWATLWRTQSKVRGRLYCVYVVFSPTLFLLR